MITNSPNNQSRKISQMRQLSYITKHQENSWIPIAQFNNKTLSYTNISMNVGAITSYAITEAEKYFEERMGELNINEEWVNLLGIANEDVELAYSVNNSNIGRRLFSYTSTYTASYIMEHIGWQKL